MTCRQLGGACDIEFKAETFEEIAQMSQHHGREMFAKNDQDHLDAMKKMQSMMQDQQSMHQWLKQKKLEFLNLPEVS